MKEKGSNLGRTIWERNPYRFFVEDPRHNFDQAKQHVANGGSLIVGFE